MRVLLCNLPWREKGRLGVRAGSRWPFTLERKGSGIPEYLPFPFFLAYAAAVLKKSGINAYLIDAIAQGLDDDAFLKKAGELAPRVCVCEIATPSFDNDMRIISRLKALRPEVITVVCGPHATSCAENILISYKDIDYVLMGEYEKAVDELIRCLRRSAALDEITGLGWRKDGAVMINLRRQALRDLDELPWPERSSLPLTRYNDGFCGLPVPNVQIMASRGCPYQCTFCLWPQALYGEHVYRARSVSDVVDEFQWLIETYGFKAVYFDDDTFNVDRHHVIALCAEIAKRRMDIPWACMGRVDLMDEELLIIMREAGLYAVKYGIESADETVLTMCGKNLDTAKARRNIEMTKERGIKVHLTFCVGLPGETEESVKKTADFINAVQPDSLQVSYAVPFPGTKLMSCMKMKGSSEDEKWFRYDGNRMCIRERGSLPFKELKDARKILENQCMENGGRKEN